jgi:hypothetical protein
MPPEIVEFFVTTPDNEGKLPIDYIDRVKFGEGEERERERERERSFYFFYLLSLPLNSTCIVEF